MPFIAPDVEQVRTGCYAAIPGIKEGLPALVIAAEIRVSEALSELPVFFVDPALVSRGLLVGDSLTNFPRRLMTASVRISHTGVHHARTGKALKENTVTAD